MEQWYYCMKQETIYAVSGLNISITFKEILFARKEIWMRYRITMNFKIYTAFCIRYNENKNQLTEHMNNTYA